MDIQSFMQGYKAAWEQRDPAMFAALFHPEVQSCCKSSVAMRI